MKKLVDNSDLGIPYTTLLNKAIVKLARSMFGINRINELYGQAADKEGVDFAESILKQLEVEIHCDGKNLDAIPREGAFIVVANHPHGALDGLLLIALLAEIRPDVKFLGNFLLTKIEPLNRFFIPVDPFDTKNSRNISGVRNAVEHLKEGHPLAIFPAGEVSTYRKGFSHIEDKPWSPSMMRFILRAGVPVVPVYIGGRNSLMFHLLGKIHPMIRTLRLPVELVNKRRDAVSVVVGTACPVRKNADETQVNQFTDLLRANVYCLGSTLLSSDDEDVTARHRRKRRTPVEPVVPKDVVDPSDPSEIEAELTRLEADTDSSLFQSGTMKAYCAPPEQIPVILHEIARLREVTFRRIGEGTLQESDRDEYDSDYHHLFIWDTQSRSIAGAYRIGFGDTLLRKRGFEGFYTYTLFEFSHRMNGMLAESVELGRSFVVETHQRRSQALLLLWRGILYMLLRHPGYRYLIGPVSTSGGYSAAAKWLMIDYIRANYWNAELAKSVVPRNGITMLGKPPVDRSLIRRISSVDMIDKLMRDVEKEGRGMPVLMKKYLQLGGKVVGFNVDPLFNDSLDAMLVLDLYDVPQSSIDMVARECTGENIYARFRSPETKNE